MSDSDRRPNVVVITAHDLGQHLGCYGVETVETPNLDGLADDGVRFENAVATTPVCSPARGSLLTGRYPQSNGLLGLTHSPWWWRLDDAEVTLPGLLGDAGYETHLAGIQHVAPDSARLEFDHTYSPEHDAETTASAIEAIFDGAGGDPIYAQFGFFETHRPLEREPVDEHGVFVPSYLQETDEIRSDLARFQAEVNYLDDRIGDLLAALDARGIREETIVVFAVDHGIPYPGAKWWCRDPGVGVSLLMDGPGLPSDTVVEPVISTVDVLPSLIETIGLPIPDRVDGVSFTDFLDGTADRPPREAAYTQFTAAGNEARGVVTTDHTLIWNVGAGRTIDYPVAAAPTDREGPNTGEPRPFLQLYDRQEDPGNLVDVADRNRAVVEDLADRLHEWLASVDDPVLHGGIQYPYHRRSVERLRGEPPDSVR